MPAPQAADLAEALKKKGGLTLSNLANFDDLITDALVDRVYFWSSIRKLKEIYNPCRGILEADVCNILQQNVIINKDPAKAQEKLLQLPGISKFHKALKTTDEKEHFLRHLRRYINMYLPDCPFEVVTTNRFTIDTAEAAVVCRRTLKKGETVKYLQGIQVGMSDEEEEELSSRQCFSIVQSARRNGKKSIFLGPARFANHDCESNATLNTTGPHGIHIVARRNIEVGEEITVNYSNHYFGPDNRECLCHTCELKQRGGWDPRGMILHESDSESSSDDEAPKKKLKPSPAAEQKNLGKRKRGVETANSGKRPIGRPRNEDRANEPRANIDERDYHGRFAKKRKTGQSERRASDPQSAPAKTSSTGPFGHMGFPRTYTTSEERKDPILDKVLRLLGSVADRSDRRMRTWEAGLGFSKSVTPIAPIISTVREPEQEVEMSDAPESDELGSDEDMDMSHEAQVMRNNRIAVRGTHGRFAKKEATRTDSAGPTKMKQDTLIAGLSSKSKLPAIRKDRSFSGLRNVVNAEDSSQSDPYSIRPSPAPGAEPAKRRRGRPRKHPLPEDLTESADVSSPSSMDTSHSSAASQASSATSMETFGNGNISQGICEMLTNGQEDEKEEIVYEEEVEEEVVEEAATRIIRTRSSLRQQQSTEQSQLLSPEKAGKLEQVRRKSPRGPEGGAVRSIEKVESDDDEDVKRGTPRTPGDYHLCEALLCTQYHRWVECRNCDEFFVQGDAYHTRIACPRCERHSKLYGYYWPKTDKEGKHDREERVLDHRTIHRFIDPEEERMERKGRKALADVLREKEKKEMSERQQSQESENVRRFRHRPSPHRSESRRMRPRVTM